MTEFEEVYQRYFRDVYRYCLALCRDEQMAEEVTQETFFKALNAIGKFDGIHIGHKKLLADCQKYIPDYDAKEARH